MDPSAPVPDAGTAASRDTEFADLMRRMREGCPHAARELVDRYGKVVLSVVRRKLPERLRTVYDSGDFTQAVWASFYGHGPDQFRFDGPDQLVNFLATLAGNKVVDEMRRKLHTQRYAMDREVSLDAGRDDGWVPANGDATPSQNAMAHERWEELVAAVPPQYREALDLLRQGFSQREVALRLNLSARTVLRLVQALRQGTPT